MKRTDQLLFIGLLCVSFTSAVLAQVDSIQRRIVDVPNVDPGAITIDGQMNEPAWANAAHADLVRADAVGKGYLVPVRAYRRSGE